MLRCDQVQEGERDDGELGDRPWSAMANLSLQRLQDQTAGGW